MKGKSGSESEKDVLICENYIEFVYWIMIIQIRHLNYAMNYNMGNAQNLCTILDVRSANTVNLQAYQSTSLIFMVKTQVMNSAFK